MVLGFLTKKIYTQTDREARIKREGSPPFTWTPGAIAATASSSIYCDTQFPASRKYSPLDWIQVVNNDVVDLTLIINAVERWPVPAGTIVTVPDDIGVRHVTLTNNDAATDTTANKIVVTLQKKALTADQYVRETVK